MVSATLDGGGGGVGGAGYNDCLGAVTSGIFAVYAMVEKTVDIKDGLLINDIALRQPVNHVEGFTVTYSLQMVA